MKSTTSKLFMLLLIPLMMITFMPVSAFAEGTSVTVDLRDLSDMARNEVLRKTSKESPILPPKVDPASVKEWTSAITSAIKDLCHDLNVEVNEFIKTPVGMIVAGTIIYNVVGKNVLEGMKQIIFGVLGWIVGMACVYFIIVKKFLMKRKVKYIDVYIDPKLGEVKRIGYQLIEPFTFRSNDARMFLGATTVVISAILTLVAMVMVLG